MQTRYEVRLAPRFKGELILRSMGRVFLPNRSYTIETLQDPELQRAIKDGCIEVVRERILTQPMHERDWKRLETIFDKSTSRIVSAIQSGLQNIRAEPQTRNDETGGGLFLPPETPVVKKRAPRTEATFVATPSIRASSVQAEEVKANSDELMSGVQALQKIREKK